ncbi:cation:proton antiporter [Pseudonocardia sp. TRM90224]|uniref:cation:proton antiporter n=1 Tax=Pseudonocardia sp. TRM90224 TaxID=2812678 RepID=UPI001E416CFC|nr:cation:proton antiporter [Pseudonocardia sp. TRM90224]
MSYNEILMFVFIDIAIVVAIARVVGWVFQRFGQPAVIGEIVAGIALGPTLLGLLPGDLHLVIFPMEARPYLNVIAQIGLILFMFIVGLEVDLSTIKERRSTASTVSIVSITLPFGLGVLVSWFLYENHMIFTNADGTTKPVEFLPFALFLGVAMSITAFPVLARILSERRMHRTSTGVLALACAAIDDVLAWSLLAVVVAVGSSGGSFLHVLQILGLTAIFALIMFFVVKPLLSRLVPWYNSKGRLTSDMLAIVLVLLLVSAYVTERIEVHAIFGAFILGTIMPRRGAGGLTREILERIEQISVLLLLPVFFVVTGLRVDIGAVGIFGIVELLVILAAAIGGKFLGAYYAARFRRVPRRQAGALGLLMNTRGLTELVILTVGVQLGILDQNLFTLMVLMALITTAMAAPLLNLVYPARIVNREIAEADAAELGEVAAFTVVVAIADGAETEALARIASEIAGREQPARVVLCRFIPARASLEIGSGLGNELAMITEAGDAMRAVAAQVEASGRVQVSVIARFSTDPVADLETVAATAQADVVLAPETAAHDGTPPALPSAARGLVSIGSAGSDGRVTVVLDGTAGARAAVRLGAHIAIARGVPLLVGSTDARAAAKRARDTIELLRRRGVEVAPLEDADHDGGLVLFSGDADPVAAAAGGASVMRIWPSELDSDEDLEQLVARIVVERPEGSTTR